MVKWSNMVIKVDVADKFHGQIDKSYLFVGISQQKTWWEMSCFSATLLLLFWQISESSTLKSHVMSQHLPHLQAIETVVQELVTGDEKMYRLRPGAVKGSGDPSLGDCSGYPLNGQHFMPSNSSCWCIAQVPDAMTYFVKNLYINKNTPPIASSLITTYL